MAHAAERGDKASIRLRVDQHGDIHGTSNPHEGFESTNLLCVNALLSWGCDSTPHLAYKLDPGPERQPRLKLNSHKSQHVYEQQ